MKAFLVRKKVILFLLGLSFVLTACGLGGQYPLISPDVRSGTPLGDSPSVANGERIYFTASSGRGGTISYQGGAAGWLRLRQPHDGAVAPRCRPGG